jgi:3-phenylpropionate/cinnamic acid dioxygenase small subunit
MRLVGDRDEIAATVHRYAELLDGGDVEGVVALFSRATWRSAATGTVLRTPEELRALYASLVPADGSAPRTRHLMHNLVIEMDDGADDASARCCYTVLEGGDPGAPLRVLLVGRYEDRYHRGDHGWHLADRVFHVDLDATSPRVSGDAGLRQVAMPRTERTGVSDGGES